MKLFLIPACVLYILNAVSDTTIVRDSQVKKIEIKAQQIKAAPEKHTVEDVYALLFKSISLNKLVVAKADSQARVLRSTAKELKEVRISNHEMLTMLTDVQQNGQKNSAQMKLVESYTNSVLLAFPLTALIWLIILLIKRTHQIAL